MNHLFLQTKISAVSLINAILSHYDLCQQDKIKINLPLFQRSNLFQVDFCIVLKSFENAYLCKTLQKYEKFIHLKARQTSPGAFVLPHESPMSMRSKKQTVAFFPLAKKASVQV